MAGLLINKDSNDRSRECTQIFGVSGRRIVGSTNRDQGASLVVHVG